MNRLPMPAPAFARRAAPRRGGALIVVLLLLVTMLIATTSLRTANVEERMAANQRDRQAAFQAAEAALRDGEQTIATSAAPFRPLRPGQFTAACTNGLCRSSPDAPVWAGLSTADWAGSKAWG
jgi:type IV pilus assembly protein PilX